MSSENRVAIFVDTENLTGWIKRHGMACLIRDLENNGELIVRKAYGCWDQGHLQVQQLILNRCGFELIHTFHPVSGKNSADIRMTVDVMEYALCGDIQTLVLATGDADFSPLFRRLNELGKQVIGAGPHSALSESVASTCQRYIYTDIPPYASAKAATKTPPLVNGNAKQALQLVTKGLESFGGRANCSALKEWMRKGNSGFDEKKLGYKRFTDFLRDIDGLSVTSTRGTWHASWEREAEVSRPASPRPAPPTAPPPEPTTDCYKRILRKKSWRFVSPELIEQCADSMRTLPPHHRPDIADAIVKQMDGAVDRTDAKKVVELMTKARLLEGHDNTADVAAVEIEITWLLKPLSNEEILRHVDRTMLRLLLTGLEATPYSFVFELFEPLLHSPSSGDHFDTLYDDVLTELQNTELVASPKTVDEVIRDHASDQA